MKREFRAFGEVISHARVCTLPKRPTCSSLREGGVGWACQNMTQPYQALATHFKRPDSFILTTLTFPLIPTLKRECGSGRMMDGSHHVPDHDLIRVGVQLLWMRVMEYVISNGIQVSSVNLHSGAVPFSCQRRQHV